MPEPATTGREGPMGRFVRLLTAGVALATLAVAVDAWIGLSRPFDPPQLAAAPQEQSGTGRAIPVVPDTVTVLTYHAVTDRPHESSAVSRRTFAGHLAALAAAGYKSVTLADVRALLDGAPVDLPQRAVLITFDGGAITDWTTADPMLARYGFTAAAFLSTGRLVDAGTPSPYLSHRQVQQLRETGRWEFGGRTHALDTMAPVPGNLRPALAHRLVAGAGVESLDAWRERVRADLAASQRYFAEHLGGPAAAFAYPFADAGTGAEAAALPQVLADAGYGLAFVGEGVPTGHIDALRARSPRYRLPRIGVRTTLSPTRLMELVYRAQPVPPPAALTALDLRPEPGNPARCFRAGAVITVEVERAGICEDPEVNTSRWLDYTLTAELSGTSRACTAVLAVRTGTGTGHYGRVEIAVGHARAAIREQILAGPRRQLAAAPVPAGTGRRTVVVRVRGRAVSVRVAGSPALTATIDRRLAAGGVALGAETGGRCVVSLKDARLTGVATA
ncbi:hypothetical protein GCM10010123_41640 [Pilimelia anulata]|uniref:NodB homology domain-containing protein n=1 Tax=Pilimelia anulata TaxID=53371 RepID=A0A8J3BAD3_9ACTN|nr:polysaccharide deacetylase family protein [Pilimelia anulata]GGK07402.1 hypothetical protein GCM10010123_41640 [Pilimelia anulata]